MQGQLAGTIDPMHYTEELAVLTGLALYRVRECQTAVDREFLDGVAGKFCSGLDNPAEGLHFYRASIAGYELSRS